MSSIDATTDEPPRHGGWNGGDDEDPTAGQPKAVSHSTDKSIRRHSDRYRKENQDAPPFVIALTRVPMLLSNEKAALHRVLIYQLVKRKVWEDGKPVLHASS
jgi:hypothetical protein